ncbi:MAG: alpha/beta fold hydrolase, partial [Actinobacteria bacterium]|nr:alpha/beta fold hydrolase [Actinomycetota bacterium]
TRSTIVECEEPRAIAWDVKAGPLPVARWRYEIEPDGYAACCGAIERMDLRGDLPRIGAPTLVVSGAEDPASAPEHQQLIAEAIPGARLELVADAAHLASVQQPHIVTGLILEHLGAA